MARNTERARARGANQERQTLPTNVAQPATAVNPALDAAIEYAAKAFAQLLAVALQGTSSSQVVHHKSALEIRSVTFARICRDGVERGLDGYWIVGRDYYMSRDRYNEALRDITQKRVRKSQPRTSVAAEIETALRAAGETQR